MLDDLNTIRNRDPENALGVAATEYKQVEFEAKVWNPENDGREIQNVVVGGMGGSALAASLLKSWLKNELNLPFEILRSYDLPAYVGENTLFIASSYSGNTEETLSALDQALARGAQVGILASGGALVDMASSYKIAHVVLPDGIQPRMAMIYNLVALVNILANFGVIDSDKYAQVKATAGWLKIESEKWTPEIEESSNLAKKIAMQAVGKTPIFYGGNLTAPVAYKWKISFNENAKNVSFWNEYSEYDHNEFIGWTSHPIEKPYAVFDIISDFENPKILKRFEISDKLLSGKRPKAFTIKLAGESVIKQMLWGCVLADFVSVYVAILNNVDPTPVDLIEKLKEELQS